MGLFNKLKKKDGGVSAIEKLINEPYSQQYFDECKYIWKNYVPERGQATCLQGELLREIEHSFGSELSPGADVEAMEAFFDKVKQEYGVELSPGYKEFLCCADGFDFNGHVLLRTTEDEDDYLSMIGINKMFHKNEDLRRY